MWTNFNDQSHILHVWPQPLLRNYEKKLAFLFTKSDCRPFILTSIDIALHLIKTQIDSTECRGPHTGGPRVKIMPLFSFALTSFFCLWFGWSLQCFLCLLIEYENELNYVVISSCHCFIYDVIGKKAQTWQTTMFFCLLEYCFNH